MKIRFFICLSFLLAVPLSVAAQEDFVLLKIKVIDSFSREFLDKAAVTVLEPDSVTMLPGRASVVTESGGPSRSGYVSRYYFAVNVPRRAEYVVKVTLPGYDEQYCRFSVPARKAGRKVKEWYVKDILLRKNYSSMDRTLGEATVTASRVAMVVKGDTIEYDARAFRLAEGSMLDNLISMLPGVTFTEDGRIYVNGQYVDKLMVNGRDFFKDNPKVALDNLPSYVVDKIKVYHEGPAWAHLIDQKNRSRGKLPLVVDVRLKREYAQGWLINVDAGGGSKTRGGWDEVYLARLFAMRYTGYSGLALYGSVNNLGDNQSPGRKGEWKKMDVTKGERKVKVGGVNLDIDGKRTGAKYGSTLEVRREDILSNQLQTSKTYNGLIARQSQYTSAKDMEQTEIKWNNDITAMSSRTFFNITPFVKYLRNREQNDSKDVQNTMSDESEEWNYYYTRDKISSDYSDNWTAGARLVSKIKSPFTGKNYNIYGNFNYTHTARDNENRENYVMMSEAPAKWQWRDALPKRSYLYNIDISRNIVDKKLKALNYYSITAGYQYDQRYESGRRDRERKVSFQDQTEPDYSGIDRRLPSMNTEEMWLTDAVNSYRTATMSRTHIPHISFNMMVRPVYFMSELKLNFSRRSINDFRNSTPHSFERKDCYFSLNNFLAYRNLSFSYDISSSLPSMLSLLNVRDSSDHLNVYLGNADLKNTVRNRFNIGYRLTQQKRQRTLNASLQGEFIRNAVGNSRIYDFETGVMTYRPRNINGNWSGEVQADYGQALDRNGRLMFNTKSRFKLTHSVDFSAVSQDLTRSVVDNYRVSEELALKYRTTGGIHIGAKGNVAYTRQLSRSQLFSNNSSTDFSYGMTFAAPVIKSLDFETDIMAYARRGYTDRSMNTTDWVWNASLTYALGHQKRWLLRAVGFDLLHQLSSVRRVVNEQGYTETRYNVMSSYAMLNIVYRLNVKPKGRKQE